MLLFFLFIFDNIMTIDPYMIEIKSKVEFPTTKSTNVCVKTHDIYFPIENYVKGNMWKTETILKIVNCNDDIYQNDDYDCFKVMRIVSKNKSWELDPIWRGIGSWASIANSFKICKEERDDAILLHPIVRMVFVMVKMLMIQRKS